MDTIDHRLVGSLRKSIQRRLALKVLTVPPLLLAGLLLASSPAGAQNVNDLLRIIIPPGNQQRPAPPVYRPMPAPMPPPQPYPQYSPPPPPPPAVNPTPSLSRADTQRAQQMLNALGYDAGAADGIAGRRTLEALNAFQRDNGLPVTARLDQQSVNTLSAVHRNVAGLGGAPAIAPPQTVAQAGLPAQAGPSAAVAANRSGPGPAFDCAKAASPTELALCDDVALGALDTQLASLYAQALSRSGPAAATLKNQQRAWLQQRNQCGADRSCLLNAYADRIAAFTTNRSAGGAEPFTANRSVGGAEPLITGTASSSFNPPGSSFDALGSPQNSGASGNVAPLAMPTPGAIASHTGSDLQKLASPPPGFRPLQFQYFQGVPILSSSSGERLSKLMDFAREAPKLAAGEPSRLKPQECGLITNFFSEEALKPYFLDKQRYGHCFAGENEFEIKDSRQGFYAHYLEALKSFAPTPPFRLALTHETHLKDYDSKSETFQLGVDLDSSFKALENAFKLSFSLPGGWPQPALQLNEAAARQLLEEVGSWTYQSNVGILSPKFQTGTRILRVMAVVDVLGIDYETRHAHTRLVSVDLYSPDRTKHVHQFTVPADSGALTRGEFPERFDLPSPASLDETFVLVQSVMQSDDPGQTDHEDWSHLFNRIRSHDDHFYRQLAANAVLPESHRLPVFPRGTDIRYDASRHQQQLQRWATAYLAGLPEEIELSLDIHPDKLHIRAQDRSASLQAFGYSPLSNSDYLGYFDPALPRADQLTYWQISSRQRVLLTAPHELSLYKLDVPQALLQKSESPLRQKVVFRLGAAKSIAHKRNNNRHLLLDLEPLRMTLENDQGIIAETDFADVSKMASVSMSTADLLTTSSDGRLGLSPSLLDALMVKALGDRLSESTLSAAAARRWQYEQAEIDPIGGAFYTRGQQAPTPEELQELGPQFSAWANTALPDGPWEFKVIVQSKDWNGLVCTGQVSDLRNTQQLPRHSAAAVTARRPLDHHNLVSGKALHQDWSSQTGQRRFARPGVAPWTKEQTLNLQMLTLAKQLEDRYQEIGERCGLSGYVPGHPDLASIYLALDDGLPPPESDSNYGSIQGEAVLEITGVRQVEREPHYSDLLPPEFVSSRGLNPPDEERNRQAIVLDVRLKEIVYFDRTGTEQIGRGQPDPDQTIESLVAAAQTLPPKYQAPEGPYGWDIVGIQLGMSMDEAESVIRQHMTVGRVLEGNRQHDGSVESGILVPVSSGKLFISEDQLEYIALIDEPPAAAGKVLAVWRRQYVPPHTVTTAEVIHALREKYGDSQGTSVSTYTRWYTPGFAACDSFGLTPPSSPIWTENGKRVELKPIDGTLFQDPPLPSPYYAPLEPKHENATECGPDMTARIDFKQAGSSMRSRGPEPMGRIEQTLTDNGPYMQAYQANREAAQAAAQEGESPQQRPGRPRF